MATFTEAYAQSAVTVSTTEYSLTNNSTTLGAQTTDGVYELYLDTANMAAGDEYEVRVYEKVVGAGSQKLAYPVFTLGGVQPFAFKLPLGVLMHGWEVSLKRTAGADRAFSWSIRQVS